MRIWEWINKFKKEEQGQALMFSVIAIIFLLIPIMMVYNVGTVVNRRIRIQNTADSAALAGAQVEADALSTIAWINNGMAIMYGQALRHIVEVNTYATLASFIEHGEAVGEPISDDEINAGTSGTLSVEEIKARYEQAWDKANEWVPKCRDWIGVLSKIEHSIAMIMPDLIEMEVYRTASANAMIKELSYGLSLATYYKKFEMNADVSNVDVFIRRLEGVETGWELLGTNSAHIKVLKLAETQWEVQNLVNGDWVRITKLTDDFYEIATHDKNGDETVLVHPHDGGGSVVGGGGSVTTVPREDGGVEITFPDGHTVAIRVNPETGKIEQDADGDGVYEEELGEEVSSSGLRVNNVSSITIGDVTVEDFNPIRVHFHNVWITMYMDGNVNIGVNIAPYVAIAELENDDYLYINHLRTSNADGRWYQYYDSDRIRHRLTDLDPDEEWDYEYNLRMIGDFLVEDDVGEYGKGRFSAFHSVFDQASRFGESYNAFSPPEWLLYRQEDHNAIYADCSGWFDTITGSVATKKDEDGKTRQLFYQTRVCWHDSDEKKKGFWFREVTDRNTGKKYLQLVLCPVCYYSSKNNGIPNLPDFPPNPYPLAVWDNIPDGTSLSDYDFDVPVLNNANSNWNDPRNPNVPKYILDAYPSGPPTSPDIPDSIVLPECIDHDGDGVTDVRKYPSDAADPVSPTYPTLVNWIKKDPHGSYDLYQSFDWSNIKRPLVLTEDFFKFGTVNVGIWQAPDNNLFVIPYPSISKRPGPSELVPKQAESIGSTQETINTYLFSCPEWGFIATASARVAFRWTDLEGNTGIFSRAGELEWLDDIYPTYQYDNTITLEDETDTRRRRQIFARRYFGNLIDPMIYAILIPTYEAIRSEDLDVHAGVDSGTNYLYKMILTESPTRINYFYSSTTWGSQEVDLNDKFGAMRYERDRGNLNISDKDMANLVTH